VYIFASQFYKISNNNRHALLKYQQKSKSATFYVHPVYELL